VSAAKKSKVRVLSGRVLYTHPEHDDSLRAPVAEALANGGIETASAVRNTEGAVVDLHPEAAASLIEQGVVERARLSLDGRDRGPG
jgi:hypothetical protein